MDWKPSWIFSQPQDTGVRRYSSNLSAMKHSCIMYNPSRSNFAIEYIYYWKVIIIRFRTIPQTHRFLELINLKCPGRNKKFEYLDNHLKGTSESQKMLRFVISGLTININPKQKEVPHGTIRWIRSSFKKYLHRYYG